MNEHNQTQMSIQELAKRCNADQIADAKRIFWQHADNSCDEGKEEFETLHPRWCQAINALPETESFGAVNVMNCEITEDILRRALGRPVGQTAH